MAVSKEKIFVIVAKYKYNNSTSRWKFEYGSTYKQGSTEFDDWLLKQKISGGFCSVEKDDIEYIIFAAEDRNLEDDDREKIKGEFTELIVKKIKDIKQKADNKILVFLHANQFHKNEINREEVKVYEFWGDGGQIKECKVIKVSQILSCIMDNKTIISSFEMYHFWPIIIDLYGIKEVLYTHKNKLKAKEYYEASDFKSKINKLRKKELKKINEIQKYLEAWETTIEFLKKESWDWLYLNCEEKISLKEILEKLYITL